MSASADTSRGRGGGLAVAVRDVRREFRVAGGGVVAAVDGVTTEIAAGDCVAFAGPSGCGKSTLLAILGALDRVTSGVVLHDGREIVSASGSELSRLRRRIGFVFQNAPMLRGLPLWENVTQTLVALGVPSRERRRAAEDALDRLGIRALADRVPEALSGGERQRAALARALVVRPRLLVADEPTSQLDADSAALVIDGIRAIAATGATVVLASHDPALLAAAREVRPMARGRLVTGDSARL